MERIEKLKEFLAVNPNDSFLKHALALELIKTGNDISAETLFNEILAHEPGYIGSYYHLGKLLERRSDYDAAMKVYSDGMSHAQLKADTHSYNELRAALEDIQE